MTFTAGVLFLSSVLWFYFDKIKGQELLSNGSFEAYYQCPFTKNAGPSCIEGYLGDWYQTLGGRIHHDDCFAGDNDSWSYADADSLTPNQGNGITTRLRFSTRMTSRGNHGDYLMSPLVEPMVDDSISRVSYYMYRNHNYPLIDHFKAAFVRDTSDLLGEQDSSGLALYTDDYWGYIDTFLGPHDQWHLIEGCHTAEGGERWIALAHFLPFVSVYIQIVSDYRRVVKRCTDLFVSVHQCVKCIFGNFL